MRQTGTHLSNAKQQFNHLANILLAFFVPLTALWEEDEYTASYNMTSARIATPEYLHQALAGVALMTVVLIAGFVDAGTHSELLVLLIPYSGIFAFSAWRVYRLGSRYGWGIYALWGRDCGAMKTYYIGAPPTETFIKSVSFVVSMFKTGKRIAKVMANDPSLYSHGAGNTTAGSLASVLDFLEKHQEQYYKNSSRQFIAYQEKKVDTLKDGCYSVDGIMQVHFANGTQSRTNVFTIDLDLEDERGTKEYLDLKNSYRELFERADASTEFDFSDLVRITMEENYSRLDEAYDKDKDDEGILGVEELIKEEQASSERSMFRMSKWLVMSKLSYHINKHIHASTVEIAEHRDGVNRNYNIIKDLTSEGE